MRLCHIVAASRNWVIGVDGELPWRIKSDLRFFKNMTTGHVILMGRKTYESIGRPLPDRFSIVLSRSGEGKKIAKNAIMVSSLEDGLEFFKTIRADWSDRLYVVGGGELYRHTMDRTSEVILTRVDARISGDTTYPDPSKNGFQLQEEGDWEVEDNWRYRVESWSRDPHS